jgi:L-rhamnose-H+ transport protein
MAPNPFLGVLFHAIGGFAAGSFYIPFKKVRGWAWETYWLTGGLFIWVICPLIVAFVTVPDLLGVYQKATWTQLMLPFLLGVGWGIGHLTFGLSLRYLGMSLGMGLSLGFCTFFGSLVPSLIEGEFIGFFGNAAGRISLGGLGICLMGIFFCTLAGASKERELPDEVKRETIQEFSFFKGVWVAFFAGVMSACFAIGVGLGEPLKNLAGAGEHGASAVYANNAPLLLILGGGGIANVVWCLVLILRNRSGSNFIDLKTPLVGNYLFCVLAGVIAYAEFFFFGMGESQMGEFSVFVSWPIHMALIIVFSNMWGLIFHEWKGTGARTRWLLAIGLLLLVGSTFVSAYGSSLMGSKP